MPMDERRADVPGIGDRISDLTLLLKATRPRGYDEYYNSRSPLLGKEISLGVLDKEDMLANYRMVGTILEYFKEGQLDLAWDFMTLYQNDIKASMSIEAKLLGQITSSEIKYSTTQTLHEYQHQKQKKGLLPKKGEK